MIKQNINFTFRKQDFNAVNSFSHKPFSSESELTIHFPYAAIFPLKYRI